MLLLHFDDVLLILGIDFGVITCIILWLCITVSLSRVIFYDCLEHRPPKPKTSSRSDPWPCPEMQGFRQPVPVTQSGLDCEVYMCPLHRYPTCCVT